ncbi:ATPase [Fusarium oxysporum f. sp. pisi HDV247]|uniref:ATPase n=2 Tax=Fusarium oxysporum TaxID=5507 RepID=W9NFV5_FUSOX|nr:ATPase [Fusarium oxysporum f. sp. pisi HDV247]
MDSEGSLAQTICDKPVNSLVTEGMEWSLKPKVTAFKERDRASGSPDRELGVTWRNLNVQVVSADAAIHENMLSQFNVPMSIKEARHKPPLKTIINNAHGCVKPGEMLLVLGRPGSGCTTLLNMISNKRQGYASVSGDIHYGSMTATEAKQYRGQIVMNTEEELFFPSLTVAQTMDFATRLKLPFCLPQVVANKEQLRTETRDFLLQSMGIDHTRDTKVGNAFIRGVSGGERKRVSIIECLATRGSVFCWDNSTRGLDASTALEWAKAIRALTDVLGLASIVTLYQAGNNIYNLFDKVLVLDEGKEIYYGPIKEARPFMEGLGFICHDGANVADYLTGVTVPTERCVRPEMESRFPRTADALRSKYEETPIYERMIAEYDYPTTDLAREKTRLFKESVQQEKDKSLPLRSALTVGFVQQAKACVARQYQILLGDKATFIGFPNSSSRAGGTFFVMLMYEFIYTGIGQFIAAYAPNEVFASLVNPLIIGILVSFCGVLVPYQQIQKFWRYWIYWLNPFNYIMGSMLVFDIWDTEIRCDDKEFARFDPPSGATCGEYLSDYLTQSMGAVSDLINPDDTSECKVCLYTKGEDYLRTLNLKEYYYGWRDAAVVVIFAISSYALVYVLMKLRTKTSKKAE